MNGKYLLKLIHSLTGQEFDHVRRSVGNVEEGVIYSKILVQIREKGQFDRKQLSGLFGVSETSMSRLIPKVSRATILALGTFQADQELKLDIALNSAWKMVFKTENEIASRIIHDIYEKAEAIERYDILFQCRRLAEVASCQIEIAGISKEELTQKQANIWQYHVLFAKAKKLGTASVVRKAVLIKELKASPLLHSEAMALSLTAKAAYHGIQTRLNFFQNDLALARDNQFKLIDLLERHHWLSRYHDFFLAKEYRALIAMLIENNQMPLANSMLLCVANLDHNSKLGQLAKWQQLYPTRLVMQMRKGNLEVADEVALEIFDLLKREGDELPATFINQNLYFIAYYYFSKGDFDAASKTLTRLMRKSRQKDFLPLNWPMVRILVALLAFELGDEVDLRDEVKNIRQTSFYQQSPYFKLVLSSLIGLSGIKSKPDLYQRIEKYQLQAKNLDNSKLNSVLFAFFDFHSWLESKKHNCPMIAKLSDKISLKDQAQSGSYGEVSS